MTTFAGEGWGQFSQIDCVISSGRQENELHVIGRKSSTDISSELRRLVFSPIFVVLVSHRPRVPGHFQVHVSITGAEWWVLPNDTGGEKSVNYTFEYS